MRRYIWAAIRSKDGTVDVHKADEEKMTEREANRIIGDYRMSYACHNSNAWQYYNCVVWWGLKSDKPNFPEGERNVHFI